MSDLNNEELQRQLGRDWLKVAGIKPGDRVKVIAPPPAESDAYGSWDRPEAWVGLTGTVLAGHECWAQLVDMELRTHQVQVLFDEEVRRTNLGRARLMPFFILVKIENDNECE